MELGFMSGVISLFYFFDAIFADRLSIMYPRINKIVV